VLLSWWALNNIGLIKLVHTLLFLASGKFVPVNGKRTSYLFLLQQVLLMSTGLIARDAVNVLHQFSAQWSPCSMIVDILLHAEESGGLLYLHNSTVSILCTTVLCLLVPVLWQGLVILMSFCNLPERKDLQAGGVRLYGFD